MKGGEIMYLSYGDVNFFEYGLLVQNNREHEYDIIFCQPIYDTPNNEELFYFGEITVCTTDSWINKKAVCDYIGMNDVFNELQFAVGCFEYYGAENFGTDFNNWQYDRQTIKEYLKHKLICNDNEFHIENIRGDKNG